MITGSTKYSIRNPLAERPHKVLWYQCDVEQLSSIFDSIKLRDEKSNDSWTRTQNTTESNSSDSDDFNPQILHEGAIESGSLTSADNVIPDVSLPGASTDCIPNQHDKNTKNSTQPTIANDNDSDSCIKNNTLNIYTTETNGQSNHNNVLSKSPRTLKRVHQKQQSAQVSPQELQQITSKQQHHTKTKSASGGREITPTSKKSLRSPRSGDHRRLHSDMLNTPTTTTTTTAKNSTHKNLIKSNPITPLSPLSNTVYSPTKLRAGTTKNSPQRDDYSIHKDFDSLASQVTQWLSQDNTYKGDEVSSFTALYEALVARISPILVLSRTDAESLINSSLSKRISFFRKMCSAYGAFTSVVRTNWKLFSDDEILSQQLQTLNQNLINSVILLARLQAQNPSCVLEDFDSRVDSCYKTVTDIVQIVKSKL